MATATLPRNVTSEPDRIPPFWSSLFKATPAQTTSANDEQPKTEKPSAVVGGLWIQIR